MLFLHLLGMVVLLGTGTSIAFFMLKAHLSGDVGMIAHVSSVVVVADACLTAPAVVVQFLTGLALAGIVGWPLFESWLLLGLGLYVFVGLHWLPVVYIQIQMRNLARLARDTGQPLDRSYFVMFRLWVILGCGGFAGVVALVWVMISKPVLF